MPIAILDHQFRFRKVNGRIAQLDGLAAETHVGKTVGDLLPALAETINPVLEQVLTTAEPVQVELTCRPFGPEETPREWLISCIPITEPSEVLIVAVELTARQQAEKALEQARIELAAKTVELQHAVWLNEMGRLLHASIAEAEAYRIIESFMSRFFPLDGGALCIANPEKNIVEVVVKWGKGPLCESVFAPDDCWALREGRLHQVNNAVSTLDCAHVVGGPASTRLCVPMVAQAQSLGLLHLRQAEEDAFTEAQLSLVNRVVEVIALALGNLKLQETFRYQALRDPLTGLYNRRYLEESVHRELRRAVRKGFSLGLMMLDIDHFKQFNDSEGHAGGDLLLRSLGKWIASHVRAEDITCRYGGDEFSLILPDTSLQQLVKRANELRHAVGRFTIQCQNKVRRGVTTSIGVALFPDHGLTLDQLMKAADNALYRAKAAGGDRVRTPRTGGLAPYRAVGTK